MVIYHAANASCFVKCLLHKCIYHPEDEAFFVGYEWLIKRFFVPDRYSKVIVYNPLLGPSGKCNEMTVKHVEQNIYQLFERLLCENNVDITKCKKIYIGSYYSEFAMYVNMKKIKHCIFEEGAGGWNIMQWNGYETFNNIVKKLDMQSYNNELVEERYGIFNSWPIDNRCDKDINFEPYKEIYMLDKENKEYFIDKFQLPKLKLNKIAAR